MKEIEKAFDASNNEIDGWMSLEEIITKKLMPAIEAGKDYDELDYQTRIAFQMIVQSMPDK